MSSTYIWDCYQYETKQNSQALAVKYVEIKILTDWHNCPLARKKEHTKNDPFPVSQADSGHTKFSH